jgi:hypothetical protein
VERVLNAGNVFTTSGRARRGLARGIARSERVRKDIFTLRGSTTSSTDTDGDSVG